MEYPISRSFSVFLGLPFSLLVLLFGFQSELRSTS